MAAPLIIDTAGALIVALVVGGVPSEGVSLGILDLGRFLGRFLGVRIGTGDLFSC